MSLGNQKDGDSDSREPGRKKGKEVGLEGKRLNIRKIRKKRCCSWQRAGAWSGDECQSCQLRTYL